MLFSTSVCLNLGTNGVRKRKLLGLGAFVFGIVLAIVFIFSKSPNLIRLVVFVPFFIGYLGLFQAHHKTCVVLGLKGQQNMDQGNEPVVDMVQKAKLRSRSISILASSTLLAALCTFLTVAIHLEQVTVPF